MLQAIKLLSASRAGSGAAAAAVATLSRLAAAGACRAKQAAVSVAIYCGSKLDEGATRDACRRLLTLMGAGLQELMLTMNSALALNLPG